MLAVAPDGIQRSFIGLELVLAALLALALGIHLFGRERMVNRIVESSRRDDARLADLKRDELTGALARRFFMEELQRDMAWGRAARRRRERPMALLLVDLDHFKKLNDSYGHAVGDLALGHVVDMLRRHFETATIGRLGGDEFAVILRGDAVQGCLERAQALCATIRQPFRAAQRQIDLSVSIGIALAGQHADFADDLIALADLALYQSKREGRSRAALFDEALLKEDRHRRFIERELRAAILLDHLDVHYQPLVDGEGRDGVWGFEALVRWRHPSLGMIAPANFIPVAEGSTLIDLLGAWVFRRVCRDARDLPGRTVSFNLSAAQLNRGNVVEMLSQTLAEHALAASRFVIEITEGVAVSATPQVLERLQTLRALGFQVALDDFGTGHCSFSALRDLPVDMVKIDRTYVSSLRDDPVAQVFVSAAAQTAHVLGLTILAEGVETEDEWLLARAAGCKLFQGYLFGRPVPLPDLARAA